MNDPVPTIRKILVPIDFSPCSHEAMRLACDLARRYAAQVLLLHVYQLPALSAPQELLLGGLDSYRQAERGLQDELAAVRRQAEEAGAGPVTTSLVVGVPVAEIMRLAREGGFDLIVIGTHGRTGLQRLLIGSVAEQVVRHAHCPVLAARGRGPRLAET